MSHEYCYIHKDGRKASSFIDSWHAISDAIGSDPSHDLMNNADRLTWESFPITDNGFARKANLVVKSEVIGTFYSD